MSLLVGGIVVLGLGLAAYNASQKPSENVIEIQGGKDLLDEVSKEVPGVTFKLGSKGLKEKHDIVKAARQLTKPSKNPPTLHQGLNVITDKQQAIDVFLGASGDAFIYIGASYCHFCVKVSPIIDELATQSPLPVVKMDVTAAEKIFKYMNFPGVPILVKTVNKEIHVYKGDRTLASLLQFSLPPPPLPPQ